MTSNYQRKSDEMIGRIDERTKQLNDTFINFISKQEEQRVIMDKTAQLLDRHLQKHKWVEKTVFITGSAIMVALSWVLEFPEKIVRFLGH